MPGRLDGKRIAVLVDNGFEQTELASPMEALKEAGARAEIISPQNQKVKGWQHDHWGDEFKVDVTLDQADAHHFDGLVLPGGVMNPDHLRMNHQAVEFVKSFFEEHKPVAAICHGPWMLVEADAVRGRTLTSWPSLRTDIGNAGGNWVDQEVVTDHGLVTSRKPADLAAFNRKMIEEFAEGQHTGQTISTGVAG